MDEAARRLRLSPSALAVAVLLVPGPLDEDRLIRAAGRQLAELEAAGATSGGVLVPWVAQHLLLLLAPDLHVEASVVSPTGQITTQVWARPDTALLGQLDAGGSVDLAPTEPGLLAWTLAAVVGLTARHAPLTAGRRSIDLGRLARFEQAVAHGDHPLAGAVLGDGVGVAAEELTVMAALVAPQRRTWRVATTWTAASGPVARSLAVVDAGPSGLWCLIDGPDAAIIARADGRLEPVSVAETWQRLVDILPPGTSISPASSPDDDPANHGSTTCLTPGPPTPNDCCASPAQSRISTPG